MPRQRLLPIPSVPALLLRRRDRTPTITVRGDIAEGLQPPDVSMAILEQLQPIIAKLPDSYRIEVAGSIEESGKANEALALLFPIMIALTLLISSSRCARSPPWSWYLRPVRLV
jgi:multidrug efflux pump subunit AcrB